MYYLIMSNLPSAFPIIILALAAVVAILLYVHEFKKRQWLEKRGEEMLEQVRQKGWNTLHESIQKSQNIIGQAELEGVKVVAEARLHTRQLEEQYSQKLSELIQQSQASISASQAQFLKFIEGLQESSQAFEQTSQSSAQARINQLFERLETRLSDFLVKTEQSTVSSIELELKSARQLIESYKNQQLSLVDENIIAMMEQTLSIVLGKKLSLKEQVDLVYESLEKAKVDKFLV